MLLYDLDLYPVILCNDFKKITQDHWLTAIESIRLYQDQEYRLVCLNGGFLCLVEDDNSVIDSLSSIELNKIGIVFYTDIIFEEEVSCWSYCSIEIGRLFN